MSKSVTSGYPLDILMQVSYVNTYAITTSCYKKKKTGGYCFLTPLSDCQHK